MLQLEKAQVLQGRALVLVSIKSLKITQHSSPQITVYLKKEKTHEILGETDLSLNLGSAVL